DSKSESMGDALREQSDDDQAPREECLVEYHKEIQIEIQDIQLEAGMPQITANINLCKQTQELQKFLVTSTKGLAYIHGKATKISVCVDNSQQPLIIDSGPHFSIVAREYLDNHVPNWEKQLLPTKAKNFKSASGKVKSIGTITKDIIRFHRKGNIILNPELVVLEDAHIQGFLLGTDYQRIYCIDIYNERANSVPASPVKKLSLLKILRKNRPEFAIGEEPLVEIKGHDIELYLNLSRPYPFLLRRTPYPENLETRKEIDKNINKPPDMDVIRKIGHNEVVEITSQVLKTWHVGKSRLCGYFRALKNYTKADRYPIPRIPHALDKLEKPKYITKIDCMKGFHQN
ncbi:hypothetical protein O181_016484, partial [Austropuccinia psidii MF-1]|nr:hypothetical protein [Austropuccinia psidii MF-1]